MVRASSPQPSPPKEERETSQRSEVNLGADQPRRFAGDLLADAAFGERDGQAAFAAIMRALDHAGVDQRPQGQVQLLFLFQVAARRRAGLQAMNALQIRRAAQPEQRVARIHDVARAG